MYPPNRAAPGVLPSLRAIAPHGDPFGPRENAMWERSITEWHPGPSNRRGTLWHGAPENFLTMCYQRPT